jgi:hypothetical protein
MTSREDLAHALLQQRTREPWRLDANCRGADPNLFFSVTKENQPDIVQHYCEPCVSRLQCVQAAINDKAEGIRGLTPKDIRTLTRTMYRTDRRPWDLTPTDIHDADSTRQGALTL